MSAGAGMGSVARGVRAGAALGLALLLAAGLLAALAASGARAEAGSWSEALAAVSDTVVFLAADGSLWRAPFHLGTHEVLWAPRRGEHLVRVSASPDGHHIAFISRIAEEDTSWIWIGGPEPPSFRGTFASLLPYRWGHLHFEPWGPTIVDPVIRGARLLQVGTRRWVRSSNTLVWTPDARGVVFGYNDGVGFVTPEDAHAIQVSRALPMDLTLLDPAPMVLVDAIVLRRDQLGGLLPPAGQMGSPGAPSGGPVNPAFQGEAWYLLYPGSGLWRAFPASGLESDRMWTASEGTVWWTAGRGHADPGTIHAARAHDPTPTVEVQGSNPVTWLGYNESLHALLWASGTSLRRHPEAGGADSLVLSTATPIEQVLRAGEGRLVVVDRDSLIALDPRAGLARAVARAGFTPARAFVAPGGDLLVAANGTRDRAAALARLDFDRGAIARLEGGAVKNGRWAELPGGAGLMVFQPGGTPPASLLLYLYAGGRWSEVRNPGIIGWEEGPAD